MNYDYNIEKPYKVLKVSSWHYKIPKDNNSFFCIEYKASQTDDSKNLYNMELYPDKVVLAHCKKNTENCIDVINVSKYVVMYKTKMSNETN